VHVDNVKEFKKHGKVAKEMKKPIAPSAGASGWLRCLA
jgi:hypothetical protein